MLSERDLGGKNRICPKSVTILRNIGFQTKNWPPFLIGHSGGGGGKERKTMYARFN